MRTFVFGAIIALLSGLPAARVAADEIDLSYDIYSRDKQLMVWVDLSSLLDAPTVTRLEDGIDLLLECQASLGVPRRFFGDNLVTRKSDIWRLSYRSVTEEYIVARPLVSDSTVSRFASLATLFQHFRDSIEVSLVPLDSLEVQERFVLTLEVTTISMTGLNIAPKEESSGGGESPLRFLFRQFLNLTDYGRNEYKTKSRPFAIDEIEPEL
ncbi:MAG: DUF4390 domain-containing protein [bacterium]|nr:DUF4390 domain-containing protein [bacterium]